MKKIMSLILTLTIFITNSAMAHPGHGEFDGYSLMHYLFSFEHEVQILIVAVIIAGVAFFVRKWIGSSVKEEDKDDA